MNEICVLCLLFKAHREFVHDFLKMFLVLFMLYHKVCLRVVHTDSVSDHCNH